MSADKETHPAGNVVAISNGKAITATPNKAKKARRRGFDGEKWRKERIKEFERHADCEIDVDTLLGQTKALAYLLSSTNDSIDLRPEDIAGLGGLLNGQLSRIELALERACIEREKERGARS